MNYRFLHFRAVFFLAASLAVAPAAIVLGQQLRDAPSPAAATAQVTPQSTAQPDGLPDEAGAKPKKPGEGPSLMAVVREQGRMNLVIHYPWKVMTKPSVEVRLLPKINEAAVEKPQPKPVSRLVLPEKKEEKRLNLGPVYFVGEYLKNDRATKVYDCFVHADDRPQVWSFTEDKTVYRVVGDRNGLGLASIYVLSYPEDNPPEKNPAVTFLELASWASDGKHLTLELPRDGFTPEGTLVVWFLRDSKVMWEERIAWPGLR